MKLMKIKRDGLLSLKKVQGSKIMFNHYLSSIESDKGGRRALMAQKGRRNPGTSEGMKFSLLTYLSRSH